MRETDDVLASIDGALRDYETSGDAMRWTPDAVRPPERLSTARLAEAAAGLVVAVCAVVAQRTPVLRRVAGPRVTSLLTVRNRTRA